MFERYAHNYTPERYKALGYGRMEYWYDQYLDKGNTPPVIPKKLHQVWIGENLIPSEFLVYMNTWKENHPLWEYNLWTDKNIKDIPSLDMDIYRRMKNVGAKSDYIRYAVLHDFGGVYIDVDFECIKPHDNLLNVKLFSSVADDTVPSIYIGHIGSVPKHPVMKKCLDTIYLFDDDNNKRIMETTGVYYFTDVVFNATTADDDIVIFPPEYFYPFPGNQRKITSRFHRFSFCTQNTYAIHHWGVSWTK